jgi:hypothetical protein
MPLKEDTTMSPALLRHALRTLIACTGLLLTACNATVGELAPDEPLGTDQAAMCAGSSVSTLTIDGASIYQGELAAAGSWAVTYPANAIRIEYYVDTSLFGYDERPGSSGTWNHGSTGLACGTHAFEVRAYPMVIDSSGLRATCLSNGPKKAMTSVSESCCVPETDAQFCTRLGMQCGPASGTDNCGNSRTISSCGTCPSGSECDMEGARNVCISRPCDPVVSCDGQCGCVSDGCGGMINCGICPTEACSGSTPYPCCDGSCSSSRFCPGVACDPAPGACAEPM